MKTIENFQEKSELPNFILPMIIDALNLSHGFWVEKNADVSEQAHFLVSQVHRWIQ